MTKVYFPRTHILLSFFGILEQLIMSVLEGAVTAAADIINVEDVINNQEVLMNFIVFCGDNMNFKLKVSSRSQENVTRIYCENVIPSKIDFNDHMAADHNDNGSIRKGIEDNNCDTCLQVLVS